MTTGQGPDSDAEDETMQQHLTVGPEGDHSGMNSQLSIRPRRKSSKAASKATKAGPSKVTKRHSRTRSRSSASNSLKSPRRNQDSSLAAPTNDVDTEQSDTAASAPKSPRQIALDREVADMNFHSKHFNLERYGNGEDLPRTTRSEARRRKT